MIRLSFIIFFFSSFLIAAALTETEPNNSCSQANIITIYDTGSGSVQKTADPDDIWTFTTPSASGSLRIYTTGYSNNNNADTDGYLYNGTATNCTTTQGSCNGNCLAIDYSPSTAVSLTYTVTANTKYYFRLNAYNSNGSNTNPYVLNFQFTPSNYSPIANNDSASTTKNTSVAIDVTANDTDSDGTINKTTVTIATAPAHGTTAVNATTGVVTYTPTTGYTGADSFTYTVKDNLGAISNAATVTITVNNPPVAVNDAAFTDKNTSVAIDVTANDTDSDGTINKTTVTIATAPAHGTTAVNATTGVVTYTPTTGYTGSDSFTYSVKDDRNATSNIATVSININNLPVAVNDSNTTNINTPVDIDVTANDTDSDGTINKTTVTVVTSPTHGSTAVNATTGIVTYTPTTDYIGTDSFTYTVKDDRNATSNIATVSINIINQSPVANYRFDECAWNGTANEVADSSGNGYNGTALNSLNTISSGKICRGTTFNGTDQYISAPGIATYLQKTASLSFWIKTTQTGDNIMWLAPGVTGVEQSGGGNDVFWGWIDATGHIGIMKGNTAGAKSTNAINDGTWKHIVLTRNSSTGSVQVYVNGVLNQTATSETGDVTTAFSSIGRIEDTGGTPAYFSGSLDEVKIFDRVLSGSDVATIYNNESASKNYDGSSRTCTECAPPPLAEYRFDECSWNGTADEILDTSGNNYPASLFNAGASTEENATAQGGICRVSKLGGNSYLQITSTFPNLTTDFTITGWFNSSNIAKTGQRIFIDDQSNTRGYGLSVNDDGNRYVRFYDRSQSGSGIIDATAAPLVSNQWYFVAAVTDVTQSLRHLYVFNSAGTLLDHKTMSISGSIGTDSGPASMGGETNSGETGNRFQGYQDEIKVFDKALSSTQVALIALNEAHHFNYDGSLRTCEVCVTPPNPVYSFDAWDSFRSINDRNVSTKIVNKPFTITVASINETNSGVQDFNGTVCVQVLNSVDQALSGWNQLLFNDQNTSNTSFTITRAVGGSDYAKIKLSWKKNTNTACPITGEDNSTIASDYFSIRPASFSITAPNAVAGINFDINFTAPMYGSTSASVDYNQSSGGSFDFTAAEHNASCPMGVFTPPLSSVSFSNGIQTFTTRYSEVGVLDLNLSDTAKPCAARYTKIDCDDANISDGTNFTADLLPIGLIQKQITIKPDHFDVNATLSNFGGGFTYLSDDLNMSAQLDLIITAKNGEGNTTKNYDRGCYAKTTSLSLPHSSVPSPLTRILYYDSLNLTETNITTSNPITSSYTASNFIQGSATPQITINFDRSRSYPMNPFDFTITSATAIDTDNVTGTGTPLGTAKFVYGRVHAYDVTTNVSPAPNPIEFEVYSTTSGGFVNGMPQNVLHWYRNLNHDAANQGNVIQGGFSAGTSNSNVNVSAAPQDGVQIVTITSTADQTVHLDISKWLWYSSKYDYLYSGTCSQHPCFNYDYTDANAGVTGVNSGTFNGSDFNMTPAKNITNKGVKLFR